MLQRDPELARAYRQLLEPDLVSPGRVAAQRPDAGQVAFGTSLPGVFAVGDVRAGSAQRVASAVGEGSVAIRDVHEYLGRLHDR